MARLCSAEENRKWAGVDGDGYDSRLHEAAEAKRGPGRAVPESASHAPRSGRGVDTTIPTVGGKVPGKGPELGGAGGGQENPRANRSGKY